MHVIHTWRVVLILDHGYSFFGHVHAEARLDLNNDEDVLGRVMPASKVGTLRVECRRQVAFLASSLLTAAVTHFSIFSLSFLL